MWRSLLVTMLQMPCLPVAGRHRTEYLKLCGINPLDRAYDDIINLGLELGLGAGLGGWARSGQG